MQRLTRIAALCLLAGLALAGCATTKQDSDYSSLPPSPRHPPGSSGTAQSDVDAGVPPPPLPQVEKLAPGDYADVLDRIRAGFGLADVQNFAIDREVEGYRVRPDFLDRTFKRGSRYLYYIVGELERRGMPMELALLPVVESAFNPVAYSRSRAAGLWQFIPSSGKHYGLEQNWWIDERRDVIESTNAALDYLEYLHRYFSGDWYLAIAAYNGGEGTVSAAVQRNANAGRSTDFFSLDLRPETRDYVPKLLAMRRIVGNPETYGLQFAPIANMPYFTTVDPGRQVHLGEAADLAGISRDDMFALNPAFNRMTTPPKGPHRLLLPVERAEAFRQAILNPEGTASIAVVAVAPPPEVRHRVRSGDNLASIARRYDVSVGELREANQLHDSVIHPGESLLIPRNGTTGAESSALAAESRTDIDAQLPEHQRQTWSKSKSKSHVHKVASGDTLWGVARRYGVSVPELAAANGLSSKSTLTAGTRLKIPGGSSSGSSAHDANRMTYKVRNGDTLSEIADKFNVSVHELMAWNGLHESKSLRKGQRLVLYVDPSRQTGG
jgi:membrane-bound lytic murein transglycosylase D